jgi:phage virion morphogenesis protein
MNSKFTIEIDDKPLKDLLKKLRARIGNMKTVMASIGEEIMNSVQGNFDAGGRYSAVGSYIGGGNKWKELSPMTKKLREKQGFGPPFEILSRSRRLRDSINPKYDENSATVGTNVFYAKIHQFGARKGEFGTAVIRIADHKRTSKKGVVHDVAGHSRNVPNPAGNVPARPFLTLHPTNLENAINMLSDYLLDLNGK